MPLPPLRLPLAVPVVVLLLVCGVAARGADPAAAARWWKDVEALASDEMQGRMTGTPEYRRAAEYVARAFEQAGLTPAGTNGFYQPVPFVSRRLVPGASTLTLVRDGAETPLAVGAEAVIGLRYDAVGGGGRAARLRRLRPVDSRKPATTTSRGST